MGAVRLFRAWNELKKFISRKCSLELLSGWNSSNILDRTQEGASKNSGTNGEIWKWAFFWRIFIVNERLSGNFVCIVDKTLLINMSWYSFRPTESIFLITEIFVDQFPLLSLPISSSTDGHNQILLSNCFFGNFSLVSAKGCQKHNFRQKSFNSYILTDLSFFWF